MYKDGVEMSFLSRAIEIESNPLHIPFSTEDGVPYTVQIFAENSAGNGTVCNVTDFTNELGESHCSASVCGCLFFLIVCCSDVYYPT